MIKFDDVSAFIFDMDGTMVDNKVFHDKAWEAFIEQYAVDGFDFDLFMTTFYGKTNTQLLSQVLGRELTQAEVLYYEEIKESFYRDRYSPHIELIEGLREFLEHISQNAKRCMIATSAPRSNVDFVLEKTGVSHYFEGIVDAAMVTEGKPSPQVYLLALGKLGLKASECLVFEDSRAGVRSAVAAGIKTVGIRTDLDDKTLCELGATFSIASFKELL